MLHVRVGFYWGGYKLGEIDGYWDVVNGPPDITWSDVNGFLPIQKV